MHTLTTISGMRAACDALRRSGKTLGFVPTMGALHEGHLSLVRAARAQCDAVAVSVFVNPAQFGPNEDFSRYPRQLENDSQMLAAEGVALMFTPGVEEMYPPGAATFVEVEGLSERNEGRMRPGHFRGVATVVSKLFHAVPADKAYFGQKDAAQCAVIRKMVRDLALPVEVVVCPIVREPDGLAMSSRNAYLTAEERQWATVLFRALTEVRRSFDAGERNASRLAETARAIFAQVPGVVPDYIEVLDPDTLLPVDVADRPTLVSVAARVGSPRLLDNIVLPGRAP
ncbi:MAG: pantoate--beta-alanine ligase [Acidobacteriales bacterium]|nr:pantoate--beta-alanine ligase [Terriglobales bacterium]